MTLIKIIIQKIVNLFGYKVSKKNINLVKNFDTILKKIFLNKKIKIIDIGANEGQSIIRFKKIFNNSKIYSIEPSETAFKKLLKKNKNKKNVFLFNFAIGEKIKKKFFYDYNDSVLSSFYKISKQNSLNLNYEKKIVKVITLDNFCKKQKLSNINILKIDTQGNEIEVLKGASKSLKKGIFDLIELEIIMGDYYEKYFSFFSIENFLIKNNYRLFALDRTPNFFNDKRLYCNAIYIKKNIYKKIKY